MAFEVTKQEWSDFWEFSKPHLKRFPVSFTFPILNNAPELGHPEWADKRDDPLSAWVNMFVELGRGPRGDYIMGHLHAVAYPLLILLCVVT